MKTPAPLGAGFGQRIRALRKQRGLSQEALAARMGFNDRQTISAIETGVRGLSAEDLIRAMGALDATLDDLTDPLRLIGEGRFSWRRRDVAAAVLEEYQDLAGRWIAAYRWLAPRVGKQPRLLRRTLPLTRRSRFEDAMAAGEGFRRQFDLGDAPGMRLAQVMEDRLGYLVLHVDAPEGISGAACQLPEVDSVLISRREAPGRRSFDLAHELFHLLTWDAMPPAHGEPSSARERSRVEQLADNFAGALLMPAQALSPLDAWKRLRREALITRLNATADRLAVTSSALRWRLVSLGALPRTVARGLPEGRLRHNGHSRAQERQSPARFSRPFFQVIGLGIDRGHISIRRAASLLDLTLDQLAESFAAHQVPFSVDI